MPTRPARGPSSSTPYAWQTTVNEQRTGNVHVRDGVTEDEFANMRSARDNTLAAPTLLLPSVQVNIRAGKFPPPAANGMRYLKIPVKFKGGAQAIFEAKRGLRTELA